jgi:hypothetical protein
VVVVILLDVMTESVITVVVPIIMSLIGSNMASHIM